MSKKNYRSCTFERAVVHKLDGTTPRTEAYYADREKTKRQQGNLPSYSAKGQPRLSTVAYNRFTSLREQGKRHDCKISLYTGDLDIKYTLIISNIGKIVCQNLDELESMLFKAIREEHKISRYKEIGFENAEIALLLFGEYFFRFSFKGE